MGKNYVHGRKILSFLYSAIRLLPKYRLIWVKADRR